MARPHLARFPLVVEHVRLHARRRPDHVAVLASGRPVTYAMLERDLTAMTAALAAFGLPRGSLVAVGVEDMYVHLLLIFGFEALGITTGSFLPSEEADCHGLLAVADLTLAVAPVPDAACRQFFPVSEDWVAEALARPAPRLDFPRAAGEDIVRVARSSGTTGRPKLMNITHRMLNARMTGWMAGRMTANARILAAMNFSVNSIYQRCATGLRVGATFMFDSAGRLSLPEILLQTNPTQMSLLPFHVQKMLDALTDWHDLPRPLLPGLQLTAMGAKLPAADRQRAEHYLTGWIREGYGANEVGGICEFDRAGNGHVYPYATIEVVGQDGQLAAPGETGELRMRTAGMVGGYRDDPAATAQMFRDGWFYPGDLGMLTEAGKLRLVGRRLDVLIVGGSKRGCADLESRIQACAPRSDIALLQQDGGSQNELVHVCVATPAAIDLDRLARTIEPFMHCRFTMRAVAAIPRTESGKIRRAVLHDTLFGQPAPAQPAPTRTTPAKEALLTTGD
jgi:acyl-coenzyme A synthetase/AMP-(fatty) acid ligase